MPPQNKGRHRAPRQPLALTALAVPVVLLVGAGGAFAGLAGPPARSEPLPAAAASVAVPPVALPRETYAKDLDALDASAARAQQAAVAQSRARAAAVERASRTRRAALKTQAAATARAAAVAKQKAEDERKALLRSRYASPSDGELTSGYGPRWGRLHAGLDFGAPTGSPVRAAAAGEVISAGVEGAYGNAVHVRHGDGTVTTYNHLSEILVRSGPVDPGDVLGLVGSTGRSTGPHLHFEVRIDDRPVDPLPWLRKNGIAV